MFKAVFEHSTIIKTLVQIIFAERSKTITMCFDRDKISTSFMKKTDRKVVSFITIDTSEIYHYEFTKEEEVYITLDVSQLLTAVNAIKIKKDKSISIQSHEKGIVVCNVEDELERVVEELHLDKEMVEYPTKMFTEHIKIPLSQFSTLIKSDNAWTKLMISSDENIVLSVVDHQGKSVNCLEVQSQNKICHGEMDCGSTIKSFKKINNMSPKGSKITISLDKKDDELWSQIIFPIGTFGAYILLNENKK